MASGFTALGEGLMASGFTALGEYNRLNNPPPTFDESWPGSMETYLDLWQTSVPSDKAYQAARDRNQQALGFMARQAGTGQTVADLQSRIDAEAIQKAALRAGAGGHPLARTAAMGQQGSMMGSMYGKAIPAGAKEISGLYGAYAKGLGGMRDIDQAAWRAALARAAQDAKLRSDLVGLGLKDLGSSYDAAMTRMKMPSGGGWWNAWGPAIKGGVAAAGAAAAQGSRGYDPYGDTKEAAAGSAADFW